MEERKESYDSHSVLREFFQNFGLEVQRPVTVPSGHEAEETSIEVV